VNRRASLSVEELSVGAYRIPLVTPESDGTLEWDSTTLVVIEARAGKETGVGYTYTDASAAPLIRERLIPLLIGEDAMEVTSAWERMIRAVRNIGVSGLAATAISAVDAALWDLKARVLNISLAALLGRAHDSIPVYGSGGFTSYSDIELQRQFSDWLEAGLRSMKMKVGRDPERDIARVTIARHAAGDDVALYVDANGAYSRKQALRFAEGFADLGVVWLEEPVVSDDLAGLRLLRDRAPAGMEITAGEYCYRAIDFRRMLDAEAVDVLQADATRCCGISGFMSAASIAESHSIQLSSHTAPMLHIAPALAVPGMRNIEWFHDHVLIERELFDGFMEPEKGSLTADSERPGNGLTFRERDARKYAV
jgi:L-alanine-DL-glutamate epimerase-like enolase superfamily enzyme